MKIRNFICKIIILAVILNILPVCVKAEENPFAGKKTANIVYLGGSITYGVGASSSANNWVGKVSKYLDETYSDVSFNHYNKGMGGTGSNYGLLRFKRDVISLKPDMLFIEFAVNDYGQPAENVKRYLESMLLTLENQCEQVPYVMFVLTPMYQNNAIVNNREPHIAVADYYGLPYIDILSDINSKDNPTEYIQSILKDHAHPNDAGYEYYSNLIIDSLSKGNFARPQQKEQKLVESSRVTLCDFLPAATQKHSDGWTQSGSILSADAEGETVTLDFVGKTIGISSYILPQGGRYTINIDGNDVATRDSYTEVANQPGLAYVNFDLEDKSHTLTITTAGKSNYEGATGTTTKLDYFIVETIEKPIVSDYSLDEQFNIVEDEATEGFGLVNWKFRNNKWVVKPQVKDGYLNMTFKGGRTEYTQSLERPFDAVYDVKGKDTVVMEMRFVLGNNIPIAECFPAITGGAYEGRIGKNGDEYVYRVRTANNKFVTIGKLLPNNTYKLTVAFDFANKTRNVTLYNETTQTSEVYNGIKFQNNIRYLSDIYFFGYALNSEDALVKVDYLTLGSN